MKAWGHFYVNFNPNSHTLHYITSFSDSGIVSTVKAVLSESSNNGNQALGMTIITSAYGTGLVLGPAVASAIADPIGQYNLTITGTAGNRVKPHK